MTFDFDEVMNMYLKAKKENVAEQLWQRWLVDYNRMNDGEPLQFISFDKYKEKAFKPKTNSTDIDKEKILKEAEEIKAMDQGQKGGS